MTGSSRLSCPGIVSGTTWCSIGQRREKGRVQQGGARHCRISVKIRRLLRKNTQTWVLSSVAKFVLCADCMSFTIGRSICGLKPVLELARFCERNKTSIYSNDECFKLRTPEMFWCFLSLFSPLKKKKTEALFES